MTRPDVVSATEISDRCGECDKRPVAVALELIDSSNFDLMWACDEHVPQLAAELHARGLDPQWHLFEIARTCLAGEGAPCGAAGDYLAIYTDGESVVTICRRHMEEWRPSS